MMKKHHILPALGLFVLIVSCRAAAPRPEMSFEEARDVVLSMQSVPLEPPARRMDDVVSVLEEHPDGPPDRLDALIRRAAAPVPEQLGARDLYLFYKTRASARYELSRFNECRKDIRAAIDWGQRARIGYMDLQQKLAELEMLAGRYESALDLTQSAVIKATNWSVGPYLAFQSRVHSRMGNFIRANMAISRAKSAYLKIPKSARLSLVIDGGILDIGTENDIYMAQAELLEAQGLYEQAHSLRARVSNYHYSKRHLRPLGSIHAQMALAENLMGQRRLVLAEREAREAVLDAVRVTGKHSGITADTVQTLGRVILAKGDLENATTLAAAQVDILGRLGLAVDEDIMVRAHLFRAAVLVAREDFKAAMSAYDQAIEGMAGNPYFLKRYARGNIGLMLCLIQNDRLAEADKLIRQTRDATWWFDATDDCVQTLAKALGALELCRTQKTEAGLDSFSEVVPALVAIINDPNGDFEKRRLADILLRIYGQMLMTLHLGGQQRPGGIDVPGELFKLADAQRCLANSALDAGIARAASLIDPTLAELVRQEQDAARKIRSLQAVFFNAVAASDQDANRSLSSLEKDIQSLSSARRVIGERIERDYPRYSHFVSPVRPSPQQVQAFLAPAEAFVYIWTTATKTCVWAIPQHGQAAFAIVDLGETEAARKVSVLRRALKPDASFLGQIPLFDLAVAHQLYEQLLQPVARAWRQAYDLLVVVKGPLAQIPLAVLPTEPATLKPEQVLLFDGYRSVPWMIRQAAITRLPSASALVTLRSRHHGRPEREAFAGFGDPIFCPSQLAAPLESVPSLASRGTRGDLAVRSIRVTELGHLDSKSLSSAAVGQLCRLPDTADEVIAIAESLEADPSADVFLGVAASETRVKTADLSRKRVLAFATHGLLPGDLDGLTQPALAFSAPDITRQDEDGLLTMGEILTLKLDADLVVLSACDTGAGDGRGNEALSGLGQAFFYAGARSLLVSMWPVETTSARMLTTGMFLNRKRTPELSWARAQRQSILELMEAEGLCNEDGVVVARYAHPLFWAPFVLVGDSRGQNGG